MKKILLQKPYMPFLVTALFAIAIAVIFKGIFPHERLDVSIYNEDYSISQSRIWFLFTAYLFFLAGIYFVISRAKLRIKRSLVISHYVFITLFLSFFVIFSVFSTPAVQRLISGFPLSTLITVYGIIFIADAFFFSLGIILLFVNLFSLKKDKIK